MDDGVISVLGTVRSWRQAYYQIIEILEKLVGAGTMTKVAYMHSAALEEALKIKDLAGNRFQIVESFICELSPVLGIHTGPGTAGLCYIPVMPDE